MIIDDHEKESSSKEYDLDDDNSEVDHQFSEDVDYWYSMTKIDLGCKQREYHK